ncbi:MAG: glycosyltransferase, partial [Alphaproteobacteria bacterium]|nr:glycosyltransferase [Alphaproteobacteria bacterium]
TAEGMPCTLQEAMASALPIIATQVGAIPKLLQNGRLGCLVPPGDVASMVRALNDCWKNHSDWQNAGLQARQYVLEKYSLDAMLLQYDEIFGEAAR